METFIIITLNEYIPTLSSDTLSIFDKDVNLESTKMFIIQERNDLYLE